MDRAAYIAHRFGGLQRFVNAREQRMVARLLGMLGRVPRVLDLPAGHGRFTPQLRRVASETLVCGDIVPEHLTALREAEAQAGSALETQHIDIYKPLPFPDRAFSLVFNFRFFHHIREPEQRAHVIREIARVSGRYLLVSYYGPALPHTLNRTFLWRRIGGRRNYPRHRLPVLTRREFRDAFAAQGFRVLRDDAAFPGLHAQHIALLERTAS